MLKISVIVPVYNVAPYLEECVQSVLNQTYSELEIILVDDGSTDESGIICDCLARENPERVVVIHGINRGPLFARIEGIKKSQGDIVLFLDGDDSFREDAFDKIVGCFLESDCDLVLFDTGDAVQYPSICIEQSLEDNIIYKAEAKKELYNKLITYQISNSVCLKAIKRACINLQHYPQQIQSVRYGEDLLMTTYFITDCQSIAYLREGLYHYRARPGSAIHSFDIQRKKAIKIVHTELEKRIDQWGMPELKPIHNARKVKGWMDTLVMLLNNKKNLTGRIFKDEILSMSNDPYFRTAYENMDKTLMSKKSQLLAFCLYHHLLVFLI